MTDIPHLSTITNRQTDVLTALKAIPDTESRYKYLIDRARGSAPLPDSMRVDKFLIAGCLSKAWLAPEFKDGKVYFYFDSEASIVKGIMSLLVHVYSGSSPDEILKTPPEFLKEGGISEHLSLNRRNGLASVSKQIMLYAVAFKSMMVK